jgi:vancomycin resistance protein YoaR
MLNGHHSNTELKRNKTIKWLLKTAIIFFAAFMLLAIATGVELFLFEKKYEFRIYPNIFVGETNLGGTTSDEAEKTLGQKINKLGQDGFPLKLNDKTSNLPTTIDSFGADLAFDVISFDSKKTIEDAYDIGRNDDFTKNLLTKINLILNKKTITMHYEMNPDKIKEVVGAAFPEGEYPARDANLTVKNGKAVVEKEKAGQVIIYDAFFADLKSRLAALDNGPIALQVKTVDPKIEESAFANNDSAKLVQEMLDQAPIELNYQSQKWSISKDIFKDWIMLKGEYAFCSTSGIAVLSDKAYSSIVGDTNITDEVCNENRDASSAIRVGLSKDTVLKYFNQKITPKLNINASNSRFEIQGGRVSQFKVGKQGQKFDADKNFLLMEYVISFKKTKKLALIVDSVNSEIDSIEKINDLGIAEIIGTGKSNFAGSPSNRRHNIKTGASTLHGILVKPGEEFSLTKTLGSIDASNGYLPELVIKKNQTIPEYGGGLCQIGTTMFRAALASGLPITARTNHSYRVPYYEPAGTDATIYDPWPDLRFINDTGNYILIQMRMSGNNISFDFWGKKDGRKVIQTKPVVYNLVKPAPTKTIETTDLKPGVKKCTEKAHTGADAYFNYTVTYPDGTVKEKRFNSHYKPWQAVCLVGVEKIKTATPPAPGTSDNKTGTPNNTSPDIVPTPSNTSTSTQKTTTQ